MFTHILFIPKFILLSFNENVIPHMIPVFVYSHKQSKVTWTCYSPYSTNVEECQAHITLYSTMYKPETNKPSLGKLLCKLCWQDWFQDVRRARQRISLAFFSSNRRKVVIYLLWPNSGISGYPLTTVTVEVVEELPSPELLQVHNWLCHQALLAL